MSWSDSGARERYVEFLQLELELMKAGAAREPAEGLLGRLSDMLDTWFPKTRAFIESRVMKESGNGFPEELIFVAWAEAHASEKGGSAVPGEWSRKDIEADMADCFREARTRAGL